MQDIRACEIVFRGYPVTLLSDGVDELLGRLERAPGGDAWAHLLNALRDAVDTAEPDEPSGWIFKSSIGDTEVRIERFGGMRSRDRHEGGQWSVYLPSER